MERINSRGIIFNGEEVYTMFRRKVLEDGTKKEYYVIPGGGVENDENLIETVIRELKEEFSVDINTLGYLGYNQFDDTTAHFFHCKITSGTPTLGGEELMSCCEDNYYEIKKINIADLDNYNVIGKDMILKAINKEYIPLEKVS